MYWNYLIPAPETHDFFEGPVDHFATMVSNSSVRVRIQQRSLQALGTRYSTGRNLVSLWKKYSFGPAVFLGILTHWIFLPSLVTKYAFLYFLPTFGCVHRMQTSVVRGKLSKRISQSATSIRFSLRPDRNKCQHPWSRPPRRLPWITNHCRFFSVYSIQVAISCSVRSYNMSIYEEANFTLWDNAFEYSKCHFTVEDYPLEYCKYVVLISFSKTFSRSAPGSNLNRPWFVQAQPFVNRFERNLVDSLFFTNIQSGWHRSITFAL